MTNRNAPEETKRSEIPKKRYDWPRLFKNVIEGKDHMGWQKNKHAKVTSKSKEGAKRGSGGKRVHRLSIRECFKLATRGNALVRNGDWTSYSRTEEKRTQKGRLEKIRDEARRNVDSQNSRIHWEMGRQIKTSTIRYKKKFH